MSSAPLLTLSSAQFEAYRNKCIGLVRDQLQDMLPRDRPDTGGLYTAMSDYPLRNGKGLRPATCIAACLAMGGTEGDVAPTAAVLELYHNAFLIHDDVEDGSEKRRNEITLHQRYGVPIAVNVGDGILAIALGPLLENIERLGLGIALRIMQTIVRMSRESAEGQMLDLSWSHVVPCSPTLRQVVRMLYKKTAWYTFIAPLAIAAEIARARANLPALRRFGICLGIAFQIIDDVLNLEGQEAQYGKEINGDLWEGKRTVILAHALANASGREVGRALAILAKPRPRNDAAMPDFERLLNELMGDGRVDRAAGALLKETVARAVIAPKSDEEVAWLRALIRRRGSIGHARTVAATYINRAIAALPHVFPSAVPSEHHRFIHSLVSYVHERAR